MSRRRQIAEYTCSLSDVMTQYLPEWRRVAHESPVLQYVLPIVEALAASTKPPLPEADTGLLRRPLHRVGMRCSLLSCGARSKVGGPNIQYKTELEILLVVFQLQWVDTGDALLAAVMQGQEQGRQVGR
jgi:hypothetical protein